MKQSDAVYIKAMLWIIVGVCRHAELSEPVFWIIMLNILFYGIAYIFYRSKEIDE